MDKLNQIGRQVDIFSDDEEEKEKNKNDKNEEDASEDEIERITLSQSETLELAVREIERDYSKYNKNEHVLTMPHHAHSLSYAQTRTSEPDKTLECYWVFPAQHEHKQIIFNINSNDYSKVTIVDEYLNDTIVDFQSKYTYSSWPASFKESVYIFNSFFWKKLIKIKKAGHTTKSAVKQLFRWTRHIKSIFDKNYLIIPKCDDVHWELIIICFAGKVIQNCLKSMDENANHDEDDATEDVIEDLEQPCIVMLDSMNGRRKTSEINLIRKWLNLEAKNQRIMDNEDEDKEEEDDEDMDGLFEFDEIFTKDTMPGYVVKVPRQPNSHDCGCFLLKNIFQFGEEKGFKDTLEKKSFALDKWYLPSEGVAYRQIISTTVARLIAEQQTVIKSLRMKHEQAKKERIKKQYKKRKEIEKGKAEKEESIE